MSDLTRHYFKSILIRADRSTEIEVNIDETGLVGNFKATRDGKELMERTLTFSGDIPTCLNRVNSWLVALEGEVLKLGYDEIATVPAEDLTG